MKEQASVSKDKIHFNCQHCGISLTVDGSLAGVTGPCPSCGRDITAPMPGVAAKVEVRPRDLERRSDLTMEGGRGVRDGRGRRRSVNPEIGTSQDYRERAEVATVVKMLVASLVVLVVAILIAWWLTSRSPA